MAVLAANMALHSTASTSLLKVALGERTSTVAWDCSLTDLRIHRNPRGKSRFQKKQLRRLTFQNYAWNTLADNPSPKTQPDPTLKDLRRYPSLLPPFNSRPTQANQISPGVWTFLQPFGFPSFGLDIGLQMTVIQLDDGSLWLHSPLALTGELAAMLKPLGEIKHIVIGNMFQEHSYFAGDYVTAFPNATVYAPRPLEEFPKLVRRRLSRVDAILTDKAPPAWAGQIDQIEFLSPQLHELNFFHRRSRTWISGDVFVYTGPDTSPAFRSLSYEQLTAGPGIDSIFLDPKYKQITQRFLKAIDGWDFDTLVLAHWNPPIANAKAVYRKTVKRFNFL